MGLGAWWKRKPFRERAAFIITAELAVVAFLAASIRRSAKVGRLFPFAPKIDWTNLTGFDSEEDSEPEPVGIVYDDEPPCRPAVVSSGMQGAPEGEFCLPPADLEPLRATDVLFAEGGHRPEWPLATKDDAKLRVSYQDVREKWHGRFGRRFSAKRESDDGTSRIHDGVDLFADPGDVVPAPEDGEVIAATSFYKGTGAVYIRTDSGIVVNLGELADGSWRRFGIKSGFDTGQRVVAGQAIGTIGTSTDGSHMLHVETFTNDASTAEIRKGAMRWIAGEPAPAKVLDPTRYLVRAQRVRYEQLA